jgi:transposase-like protein
MKLVQKCFSCNEIYVTKYGKGRNNFCCDLCEQNFKDDLKKIKKQVGEWKKSSH